MLTSDDRMNPADNRVVEVAKRLTKPITMQDVRLAAGEGRLTTAIACDLALVPARLWLDTRAQLGERHVACYLALKGA